MIDLRKKEAVVNDEVFTDGKYSISQLKYEQELGAITCFIEDAWGSHKYFFKGFKNGMPKWTDEYYLAVRYSNDRFADNALNKIILCLRTQQKESLMQINKIDLQIKEAEDDVFVLVYKGSEDDCKKAANIIGRKPGIHKGTTWYFRFGAEKDARAAWAKADGKEIKGKFTYQKLAWKDWKKITDTSESIDEKEIDMIDLREKKTSKKEDEKEIKFINKGDEFKADKAAAVKIIDVDKKDDKTEVTYKLGDEEKKGDIEDVLKMLNGAEYKKADDKKDESSLPDARCEALLDHAMQLYCGFQDIEFNKKNIKQYLNDKRSIRWLMILLNSMKKNDATSLVDYINAKYDLDLKFTRSESEESKGKSAESNEEEPVEEKKSCKEDDDAEETPAEEEPAEEKKTKKESAEDNSVEVTLTEDFHVPGTDIILEKGDVIRIIPKQEN